MIQINRKSQGFALLLTLLVVTVVVSVTLAVVELSIKQINLSVTAKDSEIAFYASNAGMECARYANRLASSTIENGTNAFSAPCFNDDVDFTRRAHGLSVSGDGDVYRYQSEVSWPTSDRCSQIDMVVMVVPATDSGNTTISNFNTIYPGYPTGKTKTCTPGSKCTIASVTGFNKSCGAITGAGTVRREILLEF